jgi:hypothetical protein
MSGSALVAISPDEAEAKAAEAAATIAGHEEFLAGFADAYDEAVRAEVRGGRTGKSRKLAERKTVVESDLPRLRSSLLAFQEILAEHQAEVAEERRAALREQGDALDAEERERLREVVAEFRMLLSAVEGWQAVQSQRETLRLANPLDMSDYPESALNAMAGVPRSTRQVFELVYRAVVEPEGGGSRQAFQGWDEFT